MLIFFKSQSGHITIWMDEGNHAARVQPLVFYYHHEETVKMEQAAPGSTAELHRDIIRAFRNGKNTFGVAHNVVGGLIGKNWGFDVQALKAAKTKVIISYNIGDTQAAPVVVETQPKKLMASNLQSISKHTPLCVT